MDRDVPSQLHLILERISSLFRAELREHATAHELKLVQLEALIYLSVANRYSDTTSALTEYLGTTKGTTSQTVMALERRGLLEKRKDANDGRVMHCELTTAGRDITAECLPASFLTDLTAPSQSDALRAATGLLRSLQAGREHRVFGQCRDCVHLQRNGPRLRCGLTDEVLTTAESRQLCREHEPKA